MQSRRRARQGLAHLDLIERAKRSDQEAVASLYRDHVRMVNSYLRACGVVEAEDLTADVFVSMVQSIDKFNGDMDQFRAWLMTIAHRRLVDHLRRSSANRSVSVSQIEAVSDGQVTSTATESELPVPNRDLASALALLTEAQREIVALRFVADLSIETVSEITGRPITAVKSLQHRALQSLRRSNLLANQSETR
ncbi:MAG: RNA polymerase sigma factor [Acidimicrobiales bacterium]